jgi:long-subunit acyl-CoA synthetase (AMP-forming)
MSITKFVHRLRDLPSGGISYFEGGKPHRLSYPQMWLDVQEAIKVLRKVGVKSRMRVGLLSENSYRWVVYDLALIELDCVSFCFPVEQFSTLNAVDIAVDHVLDLLLVSEKVGAMLKCDEPWIVSIEKNTEVNKSVRNIELRDHESTKLFDDVFTIVFSSGSSGKLKALLVSKLGIVSLIEGFGSIYPFRKDDAILAFLPLSAFQQRWMLFAAIHYGFDIQIADPMMLFPAFRLMRPTLFGAPPMFYETLENRFINLPSYQRNGLMLVGYAIAWFVPSGWKLSLQRRVFKAFHQALGGRVRLMLTGAAPTRVSTIKLFRLMGLPLYEGYGLTETGYVSVNVPGNDRLGSVGRPLDKSSVVIADDGEIITCWKHPLCLGYLNIDAEESAKTFLDQLRIATGDIGWLDEDGYLHITGRKKQIIVTRGGVKLHPETLEKTLEEIPEIGRAVIFGGCEMNAIAAVLSLRVEDTARIRKKVKEMADIINRNLSPESRILILVFTTLPFTVENGMMTRNLKVSRADIYERFKHELV